MEYASINGLKAYAGELAKDIEKQYGATIKQYLADCEDRMLAYIFPNTPASPDDEDALEQAIYAQFVHENNARNKALAEVPAGAIQFRLGEFQMQFDPEYASGKLTRRTISQAAHGILLRQGLLYRGVERAHKWG